MCWSWMNCGASSGARSRRCGCGWRCAAAHGKWWRGTGATGVQLRVAGCGRKFLRPTRAPFALATCGKRIKRWCRLTSIRRVARKKDKQTMSSASISHCASVLDASPVKVFPFPNPSSCTSPSFASFSFATTSRKLNTTSGQTHLVEPLPSTH